MHRSGERNGKCHRVVCPTARNGYFAAVHAVEPGTNRSVQLPIEYESMHRSQRTLCHVVSSLRDNTVHDGRDGDGSAAEPGER